MKEKKLSLKKQVISILSDDEKKNILGGKVVESYPYIGCLPHTMGNDCVTSAQYTCPLTLTCVPPYSDC